MEDKKDLQPVPSPEGCGHTHTPGDVMSHEYMHSHGIPHTHDHHGHTHTQTKIVSNRLARAIGHLESVKRMVDEERDCSDILIQLAAVRSALNNTAKIILKDHLEHCIDNLGVKQEELDALNQAIDKFMS